MQPLASACVAGEFFDGDFEIHVTVSCDDDGVMGLSSWASGAGLKLTHVVLARGRVCSQPMLTLAGSGSLPEQLSAASGLALKLGVDGFAVTRVKVEAAPWTRGVPRSDAQARALGPEFYFEHHVKLICDPDPGFGPAGFESLVALVAPHRAHVSWNARRVRSDGRAERFVTQRCFGVGDDSAAAALADLSAALVADGHEIASVEREFVVYDSDASLDAGWIDELADGGLR